MKIKTAILCSIGFIMLGLGAIGLFLPIWPTTPFVIIATICFASNPVLYNRIMKIPFIGELVGNYRDRKGISGKTLTVSLIFLWGMLVVSAIFSGKQSIMLLLFLVGVAVTVHILWMAKPRISKSND